MLWLHTQQVTGKFKAVSNYVYRRKKLPYNRHFQVNLLGECSDYIASSKLPAS